MTELKYLPSAWLDEYIPDPQENPDDFICQTGEMWFLRPPEDAHDDETYSQRLQHGDIVAFNENRGFGDFVLTVDADGTWSTDFYVPPEANCFRFERDNDTIAQSIEDLISSCEMREGQYDIDAYWWSDYYVPLRFVVEGETAKFVRIEGVASAVPAMQEGGTNG